MPQHDTAPVPPAQPARTDRWYRDGNHIFASGVLTGLAAYLGWDRTLVLCSRAVRRSTHGDRAVRHRLSHPRCDLAIERAGVKVADVRVASWSSRVATARTVYLEHNVAWVTYLNAVAQDPAELARPQPAINATFFDARTPLWQAVPAIDLLDLRDRIPVMYADSGSNGGGTVT